MGLCGPVGAAHLKVPPYAACVVVGFVVAEAVVGGTADVAGFVCGGADVVGSVAAGVVGCIVDAAGFVGDATVVAGVGDDALQPISTTVHNSKITKKMNSFFISRSFYLLVYFENCGHNSFIFGTNYV